MLSVSRGFVHLDDVSSEWVTDNMVAREKWFSIIICAHITYWYYIYTCLRMDNMLCTH